MNNVNIIGRIASDILRFHIDQFNKDVYRFALAFDNRTRKTDGRKDTYFIDCEAWDIVGKRMYENCNKGDRVGLSGHLEQAKFTRKDGSKGSLIKIVCSGVEFLTEKKYEEDTQPTYEEAEYEIPEDTSLPM